MELSPLLFALYVLPGFVVVSVRDLLVPQRPRAGLAYLAEVTVGSLLVIVGLYGLHYILFLMAPHLGIERVAFLPPDPLNVPQHSPPWGLILGALIIAYPVGVLWAGYLTSPWRSAFLRHLAGVEIRPHANTWPMMNRWVEGRWVRVRLKNGPTYGGWVVAAASESWQYADLILDDAAVLRPDGYIQETLAGGKVYLKFNEIVSVQLVS